RHTRFSRDWSSDVCSSDLMKDKMKSGDYLLVQMGHNDSTKEKPERFTEPYLDYKQYLKQYIDIARNRQAIPILITPVARMHYVRSEERRVGKEWRSGWMRY